MTSANLSDQPVLLENQEALDGLAGIADGFLLHDRPIQNRCDDSLVMAWQGREYFYRRSAGMSPSRSRLRAMRPVWSPSARNRRPRLPWAADSMYF